MSNYNKLNAIKNRAIIDPLIIRKDFPILNRVINGKPLNYLDSAATTQKPISVIKALDNYYALTNANVHRGLHTLAEEATSGYERARKNVADFIGGVNIEEVIFTRSTTESINLVAYSWGRENIKKGDRIVTTQMEHHANLVPWIVLAQKAGAEMAYIPIDEEGYLDLRHINDIITPNTKMVAMTQMSNVLGTINPVQEIIEQAHGVGAVTLIDGAQSVPHMSVDVKALNADFLAFSAHKMLGPTGIGVLYGKQDLLERMEPFIYGGEMINQVTYDFVNWAELPYKFEAGTPNIGGAFGFSAALGYLTELSMETVRDHEIEITGYALDRLSALDNLKIFGPMNPNHRGGAISFIDNDIHPHDIAQYLDSRGIAVRAGHHCAMPLTQLLGVSATARASFYIYNTKNEVDSLVEALKEMRRYFRHER
jgi:cysteine desulfurase/selenocysteine lyase